MGEGSWDIGVGYTTTDAGGALSALAGIGGGGVSLGATAPRPSLDAGMGEAPFAGVKRRGGAMGPLVC